MISYLKSGLIDDPKPSFSDDTKCVDGWNRILSLWPNELLLIFEDPALPLRFGMNGSLPINMLFGWDDGLKFPGIFTGFVLLPCNSPKKQALLIGM